MTSRIVFGPAFLEAIRVRGLTLTEVARRAPAVRGHAVNITTALRLARVVSAAPTVPELEAWTRGPESAPRGDDDPGVADAHG